MSGPIGNKQTVPHIATTPTESTPIVGGISADKITTPSTNNAATIENPPRRTLLANENNGSIFAKIFRFVSKGTTPDLERKSSVDTETSSDSFEIIEEIEDTGTYEPANAPLSSNEETRAKGLYEENKQFYTYDSFKGCFAIHRSLTDDEREKLGGSKDMGGHGGTLKGILQIEGKDCQVFLKPFDGVEARNYVLLKEQGLDKWTPKIYGVVDDGKGNKFLVMENTRKSENGGDLEQIADIKNGGNPQELKGKNPIASQEEMLATRGRKKSVFDFMQMKMGAIRAPGFLLCRNSPVLGKFGRILNYKDSKPNLQKNLLSAIDRPVKEELETVIRYLKTTGANKAQIQQLEKILSRGSTTLLKDLETILPQLEKSGVNLSPLKKEIGAAKGHLDGLISDLARMQGDFAKSDVAMIGLSEIIMKKPGGGFEKPRAIDPAHMMCNPAKKEQFEGQGYYCGTQEEYDARKLANIQGFTDLIKAIQEMM